MQPSEGPRGCQCHCDITGLQDSQAKQIYEDQETHGLLDIRICLDDGADRPVHRDVDRKILDADHEILLSKKG